MEGFAEWQATGEIGDYDWGAADLMLPGADCWVFDHRVIRWNFQRGDNTNPRVYTFSSDPRTIRDITAAFEIAWDRAIPHADYKIE